MKNKRGWKELGSGSDAAFLVWAPEFEDLLTEGARAIVCFSAGIRHEASRVRSGPRVSLRSYDQVDLLIDWLNEVNYRLLVHRWVTWVPIFTSLSDHDLISRMDGYLLDHAKESVEREIKAVTRHRPYLSRGKDSTWVARLTVDL